MSAGAAVEKIGGNIAHEDADKNSLKRDANGPEEDLGIKKVFKKFSVIAKLKSRDISSTWGAEPEAVDNDKTNRNDEK